MPPYLHLLLFYLIAAIVSKSFHASFNHIPPWAHGLLSTNDSSMVHGLSMNAAVLPKYILCGCGILAHLEWCLFNLCSFLNDCSRLRAPLYNDQLIDCVAHRFLVGNILEFQVDDTIHINYTFIYLFNNKNRWSSLSDVVVVNISETQSLNLMCYAVFFNIQYISM